MKGITVTLHSKTASGVDEFNRPIYTEEAVSVADVLVSPASSQEQAETLNLMGKKIVYTLAIPKGDEHEWENAKVSFFGRTWEVVNFVTQGIEENIPLRWNKQVQVARCE